MELKDEDKAAWISTAAPGLEKVSAVPDVHQLTEQVRRIRRKLGIDEGSTVQVPGSVAGVRGGASGCDGPDAGERRAYNI